MKTESNKTFEDVRTVTEEQKEKIRQSPYYSEDKFNLLWWKWQKLFPLATQEEIEELTWKSFIYN